jgi:uncharacterized protein YjbI with pentapeptide repeats
MRAGPPEPIGFATKAKDLQSLRDALVDAATISGTLWLSYLFAFFYLSIAVGGVKHEDLFFSDPVKLPFLNVDLPLIGFFVLGPLLFLIIHAYTLLHFALLAAKVDAFHTELEAQIGFEETRARLRRQLPSNIFVQFLAGPRDVRTGIMGFLLRLIAWISLILGPIALMVFFQLQFLPYHDATVSWWQRIAVILELVLLWLLWPPIARGKGLRWSDLLRSKIACLVVLSAIPAILVFTVATIPGEWLDQDIPKLPLVPEAWTLHKLLIAGEVDMVAQRPKSLWSNRLIVPGIDVIDHSKYDTEAKIIALPQTRLLRGRNLERAVLLGAHLRKADFTGAKLTEALLDEADLRQAKFDCASIGSAEQCADPRGASLVKAQFNGAFMRGAQLQGAHLNFSQMQGAVLNDAQLEGAVLYMTELHGASLTGASFEGALLTQTELEAAFLANTKFQGTIFEKTQLQGTLLYSSGFMGTLLDHVFVWRTSFTGGETPKSTMVIEAETRSKFMGLTCSSWQTCEWSPDAFSMLKQNIEAWALPMPTAQVVMDFLAKLNPEKKDVNPQISEQYWAGIQQSGNSEEYKKALIEVLHKTACSAKNGAYVVRALIPRLRRNFPPRPLPTELATALLEDASCTSMLSETDTGALWRISYGID